MADFKKTVEINIDVTGTDKDKLKNLAASFTAVGDVIKGISSQINTLKADLESIKVPTNLTNIIDTLGKFNEVKVPNVKQIAEGFERLAKITTPPDLSKFAVELDKFTKIKVPNIKQLAVGLEKLTDASLSMTAVGARLRIVSRNLKSFSELKVPNLKSFVESLQKLTDSSLSMTAVGNRFRVLYRNIKQFSELKLPNIAGLVKGLRELTDSSLSMTAVGSRLRIIQRNLKSFSEIRIPNITSIVSGLKLLTDSSLSMGEVGGRLRVLYRNLKNFSEINLPNITKIVTSLKALTDSSLSMTAVGNRLRILTRNLVRFSDVKLPNITALVKGLQQLTDSSLSMTAVGNRLRVLQRNLKDFTNIKLPNVTGIVAGLKKLTDASLSMADVGARLRILYRNLKKFTDIKVPNITKIAAGLTELNKVAGINVQTKALSSLADFLVKLNGIKVPNLTTLSAGLKELGSSTIKLLPAIQTLNTLYHALKQYTTIKVPNMSAFVSGLKKLEDLKVGPVTAKLKELNEAIGKLDKAGYLKNFATFANDLRKIAPALNTANAALEKYSGAVKKASTATRGFGERVKNYFQYRLIADAVFKIKEAIIGSWEAIKNYDQALKDLQAITGATSLEVAQMGTTIKEVASTTKFSAQEVAEGMRTIGQAGFSAAEAIQTMQAVSNLATGTLSDMSTTVDLVTTAMRVFKIDASESAMVSDVFANAVNRSKLTIDKLRTSFNYVGPIAKEAGVSFKEMSASMMTLANSGLRASTIGTGLRRVFAELVDPSTKLRAAISEAGLSLGDLDPQTRGLAEVIQNLGLVIDNTQKAFDIFGKRGAAAVLALADTEGQFNTMLETVGRSGTAAAQAAKQMEGLGVSFKNLQDKLGLLAIAIGEAGIADALKIVIDIARDVVDAITAIANTAFTSFILKSALVVAAITAIVVVGGRLVLISRVVFTAIGSLVAVTTAWTASLLGLEASLGLVLLVLNPLMVVLTGIAVAGAYAFATLDKAKEAAEDAAILADEYASLGKVFQDYQSNTSSMRDGSDQLKEANLTLRDDLLKTASGMSEVADEAANAAASIDPLNGEIAKGGEALRKYSDAVEKLTFQNLVTSAQAAEENVAKNVSGTNRFVNRWKDAISQVGTLASGIGDSVVAAFDLKFDRIPEIIKNSLGNTTEYGKRVQESLDFSKALDSSEKSFKEFSDYVGGLRGITNLTAQEKDLLDSFTLLDQRSQALLDNLVDFGKIDMRDTLENIERIATEADISGKELDAILAKVEKFQNLKADGFTNLIEKWGKDSKDGTKRISSYIDELKQLGGQIDAQQISQIAKSRESKASLVSQLETEKAILQLALDSNQNKEEAYKRFYDAQAKLIKEAEAIRKEDAKNEAQQKLIALKNAEIAYEASQAKILIKAKYNTGLRIKLLKEEEVKYRKIQEDIALGGNEKARYEKWKKTLAAEENEYKLHIERLRTIEEDSNDPARIDGARAAQAKATLEHFLIQEAAARKYYQESLDSEELSATEKKKILDNYSKYKLGLERAITNAVKTQLKIQTDEQERAYDSQLETIKDNIAEVIEELNGIAPKQLGKTVEAVFNNIIRQENKLLKALRANNDTIDAIREKSADKREKINSRGLTASEKYLANRTKAEEAFAKAQALRERALLEKGAAQAELLKLSNKQYEKGVQYAEKLKGIADKGALADKVKSDQYILIDKYEKGLIQNAELAKTANENELAVWKEKKTEVEALKEKYDALKTATEQPINVSVQTDIGSLLTELGTVADRVKDSIKDVPFNFTYTGTDAVRTEIKSIDKSVDTFGKHWKDVWKKGYSEANIVLDALSKRVKTILSDVEIDVDTPDYGGNLDFGADVSLINSGIDDIQTKISNIKDIEIDLGIDTSQAKLALDATSTSIGLVKDKAESLIETATDVLEPTEELTEELEKFKDRTITLTINYSITAIRHIHELLADWLSFKDRSVSLDVSVIGADIISKLNADLDAIGLKLEKLSEDNKKTEPESTSKAPLIDVSPYEENISIIQDLIVESKTWNTETLANNKAQIEGANKLVDALIKEKEAKQAVVQIQSENETDSKEEVENTEKVIEVRKKQEQIVRDVIEANNDLNDVLQPAPIHLEDLEVDVSEVKKDAIEVPVKVVYEEGDEGYQNEKLNKTWDEYEKIIKSLSAERKAEQASLAVAIAKNNLEAITGFTSQREISAENTQLKLADLAKEEAALKTIQQYQTDLGLEEGLIQSKADLNALEVERLRLIGVQLEAIKELNDAEKEGLSRAETLRLEADATRAGLGENKTDIQRIGERYNAEKAVSDQILKLRNKELAQISKNDTVERQKKNNEIMDLTTQQAQNYLAYQQEVAAKDLENTERLWRMKKASAEEYLAAIRHADDLGVISHQEAQDKMIDASGNLQKQFTKGWDEGLERMTTVGEYTEQLAQRIQTAMVDDLSDGILDVIDGTKNLADAFADMATAIIKDLTRILLRMALTNMFFPGRAEGGLIGDASDSPLKRATGGIIQKLATGGSVLKEKVQHLAEGGGVIQGYSPSSTADNIPIMATAFEYMQPVKAVKHYGLQFMESIRTLRFPKALTQSFTNITNLPSMPPSNSLNFAMGGSIPEASTAMSSNTNNISVPVNVSGVDNPGRMAASMQMEIEDTVMNVLKRELR